MIHPIYYFPVLTWIKHPLKVECFRFPHFNIYLFISNCCLVLNYVLSAPVIFSCLCRAHWGQ